ncbi:MAG: hypothetical protein IPI89_09075 [Propionivibrio sp.]|nr:hypothetical protein [Propionivibrio sp.]
MANQLMNEAFPIGLWAFRYFGGSEHVSINLKIGSQTFDAIVSDGRNQGSSVKYVEVTMAYEGEDDFLRMCELHEKGEVSGLGPVTRSGTKRTRKTIDVAMEAVSQAEVLRRERDRVGQAIVRKLGKPYPPNTVLLIGFDDTMAFDRQENIENLETTISEHLPKLKEFHSIAIVGLQKGLFICWPTDSTI